MGIIMESTNENSLDVMNKAGIIYLSRIPTNMNVSLIRETFAKYGEIGRIFLQPNEKLTKSKKRRSFTEGWIEFTKKKIAKSVAETLNNTKVGGKKTNKSHDELWNIKYLHKFKWTHLNERLAYERAVYQQRMRTEVSQAKKETSFYTKNVGKAMIEKRKRNKIGKNIEENFDTRMWTFKQKQTEDEILQLKSNIGDSNCHLHNFNDSKTKSKTFLKNLFSGGLIDEEL